MGEAKQDKARNRKIAENEAERQTVSAIRVSIWVIGLAVVNRRRCRRSTRGVRFRRPRTC
jgi:hypothetical protein